MRARALRTSAAWTLVVCASAPRLLAASAALTLALAACSTAPGHAPHPSPAAAQAPAAHDASAAPPVAPRLGHEPKVEPEAATPAVAASAARAPRHFRSEAVVAAHPLAAQAGARMLREGGSAVDAAVATQMVLGLVEPQSSGLGGGAFMLVWDGARVHAYDGRETAPAAVDEALFLDAQGAPLAFMAAAVGGRSVGVPGTLRMLELAHRKHGRLPWAHLLEPAIALAEQGFAVSPRLHALLESDSALRSDATARALYYGADGHALPVGTLLRNPEYAAVLRVIAREGAGALYQGNIAHAIVAAVRGHAANPGHLALSDLAHYRAIEREPLCSRWMQWRICGMPPPSAGGLVTAQILELLERTPRPTHLDEPEGLHRFAEAARLATADRERYVADPAFTAAPAGDWDSLLAPTYLDARAALIGATAMPHAPPGDPERRAAVAARHAPHAVDVSLPATSHLSIVDARGQVVAMTTSIEAQFGARLMVNRGVGLAGGFLLNNQLTDFSFAPRDANGRLVVNRVEPGKRPRSNMSPTLVFEPGARPGSWRPVAALGSPGGSVIPQYVAKTLWAGFVDGLDAQAAVAAPNLADTLDGPILLEAGRFDAATMAALRARGHALRERSLTSGVHLLRRDAQGWQAGADPRREGSAAGR